MIGKLFLSIGIIFCLALSIAQQAEAQNGAFCSYRVLQPKTINDSLKEVFCKEIGTHLKTLGNDFKWKPYDKDVDIKKTCNGGNYQLCLKITSYAKGTSLTSFRVDMVPGPKYIQRVLIRDWENSFDTENQKTFEEDFLDWIKIISDLIDAELTGISRERWVLSECFKFNPKMKGDKQYYASKVTRKIPVLLNAGSDKEYLVKGFHRNSATPEKTYSQRCSGNRNYVNYKFLRENFGAMILKNGDFSKDAPNKYELYLEYNDDSETVPIELKKKVYKNYKELSKGLLIQIQENLPKKMTDTFED